MFILKNEVLNLHIFNVVSNMLTRSSAKTPLIWWAAAPPCVYLSTLKRVPFLHLVGKNCTDLYRIQLNFKIHWETFQVHCIECPYTFLCFIIKYNWCSLISNEKNRGTLKLWKSFSPLFSLKILSISKIQRILTLWVIVVERGFLLNERKLI